MQSPETSSPIETAPVPLIDIESGELLNADVLLTRAASAVDSVAAKGMRDAEAVAKSLGGELDEEVAFDLEKYRQQLAEARHELAVRLGIDVPLLVGDDEEGAGEVHETRDVDGAVAYLTGEHPDQQWVETEIHFLKEQGYDNAQIIEAYLRADKWGDILFNPEVLEMPRQEFFDELACIPGGLELFQENTSAGDCISTEAFGRIVAEPGGVNRGFKYMKFFSSPRDCIWMYSEAIEMEEHPDQLSVLTALETFPHLLDYEAVMSALRRSEKRPGEEDAIRDIAETAALFWIGEKQPAAALDVLRSVGLLEACRSDREFAKKVLDSSWKFPGNVVEIARDFPEIGTIVKQSERDRQRAELAVVFSVQNNTAADLPGMVRLYGLTWSSIAKNDTVRQWMEYPSKGALAHAELKVLLELMKPPREQIMKAVNKALISAIDSPYGYVDLESYEAIQITFGLSEAERASVRLEEVGYEHVKAKILAQEFPVSVAERVLGSSQHRDELLARFRSKETQDLVWSTFEAALSYNQFSAARKLEFFGLDAERMKVLARNRYLGLLEEGMPRSVTNDLTEQFDIDVDDFSRSKIDVAIQRGIWETLSSSYLQPLASFVVSHDVSVAAAKIGEQERSRADLLMKENVLSYLKLSDPQRAKLKELFGVSVESLRFPDAAPYLEKQAVAMIRDSKDELAALREAVPRIVEQEWYRGAARTRVYEFLKNGTGRDVDVRSFLAGMQKLTGLPSWLFRSPEILSIAQERIRYSLTQENYEAVIPYVEAFGISVRDDIAASIENGDTVGLYQFGALIDQPSVDEWKQGAVRTALERTARDNPNLGEELRAFYADRRNFNGLAMAIDLGIAGVPYLDESDALRELQKLVTNGDAIAAEGLLKCYGLGGKLFDAGLRDRIKHAALVERKRRTNRETVALDKNKHRVERELADFYLDEWIGFELSSLERKAQQKNVDLDFSSKMDAYNLKDAMRENTENQFGWMREYLARSVFGELRHQNDFSLPTRSFVPLPADTDAWISQATNEEIRQRMLAARERFTEEGWSSSYGGKPWAQIAATAEMMFGNEPDKHKLVDLAYDLSHNNGSVFNKEAGRIEQMSTAKIGHVLSAKREVSDPEAYLALLEREVEPATFADAKRRWDDWKDVRAKLEREIDGAAENRRAGYIDAIRERSVQADPDVRQMTAQLSEMGTNNLEEFISSKLLNAGRDGRTYLRNSAAEAIRKHLRDIPGGVVGVIERMGLKGANRNAELDVFAPLVSAYLKLRADVIRDETELNLASDIIRSRKGGPPVGENLMAPAPIPSEIREIIAAIVKP